MDKYRLPNIKLEPLNHFYYNTDDNSRYTSVTGVLSLIKNEFNDKPLIEGLQKSYENFNIWYKEQTESIDNKNYIELVNKYYSYKSFRPYEIRTNYEGEEYKAYKKLKDYTIEELDNELSLLSINNKLKNPKLIYAKSYMAIMSYSEIKDLWKDVTYIANIYGSMVHTISETFFKIRGDELDSDEVEAEAHRLYDELIQLIPHSVDKWSTNTETFKSYIVDICYKEFKEHIIGSFLKLKGDLGQYSISERIMFSLKYLLAGMTDTLIHITNEIFDINDHKTNKHFSFKSEYDLKLKAPFDMYDECDYILYSLQLSIYGLMYEIENNFKVENRAMWISYYDRNKNEFERIDIKYLKDEARQLLEMHRLHTMDLENKWNTYKPLQSVNPKHKRHLISLLEKKINYYKSNGVDRNDINNNLKKFITEYKTWKV